MLCLSSRDRECLIAASPKWTLLAHAARIEFQFGKHLNKSVIAMAPAGFVLKQYVWIEQTAFEIAEFYIERAEIILIRSSTLSGLIGVPRFKSPTNATDKPCPCITCHYLLLVFASGTVTEGLA